MRRNAKQVASYQVLRVLQISFIVISYLVFAIERQFQTHFVKFFLDFGILIEIFFVS